MYKCENIFKKPKHLFTKKLCFGFFGFFGIIYNTRIYFVEIAKEGRMKESMLQSNYTLSTN